MKDRALEMDEANEVAVKDKTLKRRMGRIESTQVILATSQRSTNMSCFLICHCMNSV